MRNHGLDSRLAGLQGLVRNGKAKANAEEDGGTSQYDQCAGVVENFGQAKLAESSRSKAAYHTYFGHHMQVEIPLSMAMAILTIIKIAVHPNVGGRSLTCRGCVDADECLAMT